MIRAILLAVLFAASCGADEPLTFAEINREHQPIRIGHPAGKKIQAIFGVVDGDAVRWQMLPEEHFVRGETHTVLAAPAGEYILTTGESKTLRIIGEGRPNPKPPDPNPDPPDPDPQPNPDGDTVKATHAIWLEEMMDRNKHQDAKNVMLDPQMWAEVLEPRGIQRVIADDDQTDAGTRKWVSRVPDLRPALILWDRNSDEWLKFPAPKSRDEMETLVRKHVIR